MSRMSGGSDKRETHLLIMSVDFGCDQEHHRKSAKIVQRMCRFPVGGASFRACLLGHLTELGHCLHQVDPGDVVKKLFKEIRNECLEMTKVVNQAFGRAFWALHNSAASCWRSGCLVLLWLD